MQGLWRGCLPSLIMVSNPTAQYVLYEWLVARLAEWRGRTAKAGEAHAAAELHRRAGHSALLRVVATPAGATAKLQSQHWRGRGLCAMVEGTLCHFGSGSDACPCNCWDTELALMGERPQCCGRAAGLCTADVGGGRLRLGWRFAKLPGMVHRWASGSMRGMWPCPQLCCALHLL